MGGVPPQKIFLAGLLFLLALGNGAAASFPDTATCTNTPTIDFPTDVTLGKDFLFLTKCATADFNAGDFVTVWIEDNGGSPILPVSKFVETDTGVEWVSPLSDNAGQAWERVFFEPEIFDCNETGVPYSIEVNWDTQTASQAFTVHCPTVDLIKYRQELPYWESLRVEAQVSDYRGYKMVGVPCTSKVLDIGRDANASVTTIKQEYETVLTDSSGRARFEYSSGLFNDLLQGYSYTVDVYCLGGDANFVFVVEGQSNQALRNPLYFFLVYVSENIVPLLAAFLVGLIAIGLLYLIFLRNA